MLSVYAWATNIYTQIEIWASIPVLKKLQSSVCYIVCKITEHAQYQIFLGLYKNVYFTLCIHEHEQRTYEHSPYVETHFWCIHRGFNFLLDLHNTNTTPNIIITQITRPYALSINLDFLNVEIVNCEYLFYLNPILA